MRFIKQNLLLLFTFLLFIGSIFSYSLPTNYNNIGTISLSYNTTTSQGIYLNDSMGMDNVAPSGTIDIDDELTHYLYYKKNTSASDEWSQYVHLDDIGFGDSQSYKINSSYLDTDSTYQIRAYVVVSGSVNTMSSQIEVITPNSWTLKPSITILNATKINDTHYYIRANVSLNGYDTINYRFNYENYNQDNWAYNYERQTSTNGVISEIIEVVNDSVYRYEVYYNNYQFSYLLFLKYLLFFIIFLICFDFFVFKFFEC